MEAPQLESNIWQVYGPNQTTVLGIDLGESATTVRNWVSAKGLTYPFLLDPPGTVYDRFGDGYIPYNALLDRFHVLRFSDSGYDQQAIIDLIEFYGGPFYAHDPYINAYFMNIGTDTLNLTSQLINPDQRNISVRAMLTSVDDAIKDSLELMDDGAHGDGDAGDGIFGGFILPQAAENEFVVDLKAVEAGSNEVVTLEKATRFTTVGPLFVEDYQIVNMVSDFIFLKITIHNGSATGTAQNVKASLSTADTAITNITSNLQPFGNIGPGQSATCTNMFFLRHDGSADSVFFNVHISGNDYPYWESEFTMDILAADITKNDENVPHAFNLAQNYPNPFNPSTQIRFSIPQKEMVSLIVYNHLGEKVRTLVNEELALGDYTVDFNAASLSSGLYYYKITAGQFDQTKKMILIK